MTSDSLEVISLLIERVVRVAHTFEKAVRPKLEMVKTIEEAAAAVDEMLASAFQGAGLSLMI